MRTPRRHILSLFATLGLTFTAGVAVGQPVSKDAAPAHPRVCPAGVRVYDELSQVPAPFDSSLRMPPGEPIRVTSPGEAEQAEMQMRARAGSVGATGLVMSREESTDDQGNVRMRMRLVPVFVAADSARAQQACAGKP